MKQLSVVEDVELELTTLCNAKCQLCYRNYTSFNDHYPGTQIRPFDAIVSQLDTFPQLKWVRLVGTISEPTLYPHFLELVAYIKSKNINIEICTNGDTNTHEWWAELSGLLTSTDRVYFTICGSTQQLHEQYRRNTRLCRILSNATAFRSSKHNDYAQCIRFRYNSDDLDSPEFANVVSAFSHIYWTETFLLKSHDTYMDSKNIELLQPNTAKVNDYMQIDKFARAKFSNPIKGRAYCMSWENKSQQIDINGKVYPCYLFLEASGGEEWDGDYDRILNMDYDVCKYCDRAVVDLCNKKDLRYII